MSEQRSYTDAQRAYFNNLFQRMVDRHEEETVWLKRELMVMPRRVDFLYRLERFKWGGLMLYVPAHKQGRDVCMLQYLGTDLGRVHYLTPKDMDAMSTLVGRFGDHFEYRLRSDTVWSDRNTHLLYEVKPKYDPKQSGVN